MLSDGFDFDTPCTIDFNVDFGAWPPPDQAIQLLKQQFPGKTKVYAHADKKDGYVLLQVVQLLSYEFVIHVQSTVSELMSPYGGICESWGVFHR